MQKGDPMLRYVFVGQLYKYVGEQSNRHPGELTWPSYRGFPVLGGFNYNDEGLYLTSVGYFHAYTFDLDKPEDREYYQWVMDRIVNGWFLKVRDELIRENGKIKIYLEWVQRYLKQLPSSFIQKTLLEEDSYAL